MTSDEDEIEATRIAGTPRPQSAGDNVADAAADATRVPASDDEAVDATRVAGSGAPSERTGTDAPAPAATPRPPNAAAGSPTPTATPSLTPGGTAIPSGLQFHPGQMILARYRMKKLLGRGGFGVVWRASDENLHMDVAIKFLAPEIVHNPEAIEDLKQETRYSLRLTHPNIVRIHGFFQDDELAGILMEYVDGGTLQSLKLKQPNRCFEVDEVAKWVPAMCAALDYAHAKVKLVHRDLKPANIMLDAAGDVKVADFGISSSISDTHSRLSMGHATSGTPVYMSPQHLIGQRPSVSDDIYSFGATLFDLLAGKPPFYTGDIGEQVRRVTAPTIGERRRELGFAGAPIPRVWEEVIASCLAKDPASRPASAGDIAVMLGLVAGSVAPRESASAAAAIDPGDEAFATRPISQGGAASAQHAEHAQRTPPPAAHAAATATIGVGGSASLADAAPLDRAPAPTPPHARGPNKGLIAGGVAVVLALAAFGVSKMMGGGEGAPRGGDSQGAEASAGSPARTTVGATASDDRGAAVPSDASAARDQRSSDDARATSGASSSSRPPVPASPSPSPASAPSSGDSRAAAGAPTPGAPSPRVAPPELPPAEVARDDAPPPAERTEPAPSREKPSATKVSADDGVRATLAAYEDALESLDAGAYASLWRSLAGDERKKVERAFQQFRAQAVTLSIDAIDVNGATAKARFVEKRTLTPNVGSPITQERKVAMTLERSGDGAWRILEMK